MLLGWISNSWGVLFILRMLDASRVCRQIYLWNGRADGDIYCVYEEEKSAGVDGLRNRNWEQVATSYNGWGLTHKEP